MPFQPRNPGCEHRLWSCLATTWKFPMETSMKIIWLWINTYENTIWYVGWTSILTQLFWCEQKGYKVLTHCHMFFFQYPCITIGVSIMFFFICQASNLTYAASCWLFSVGSEDADIDVLVMSKAKEPRLFVFCWARGQPSRPVAIDPSLKWWFHQLKMMIEPSQILRVVRCFCFFFFFRNLWGVKYHSLVWQWGQLGYNQPKLT